MIGVYLALCLLSAIGTTIWAAKQPGYDDFEVGGSFVAGFVFMPLTVLLLVMLGVGKLTRKVISP